MAMKSHVFRPGAWSAWILWFGFGYSTEVTMRDNQSLSARMAVSTDALREVRQAAAALAVAILDDNRGCSVKTYRQLQVLFVRIGRMPELPVVETEGGRVYLREEEYSHVEGGV
jgi:hypothetical protein